ncbi:FtsX-like permease family protein [Candidatus Parcubacteria bacterium]|nr:MAG: FtsX-like permease family protein [Candidatus Parcubacteria bacterium]
MQIFNTLQIASAALKKNKGRTILTILGVVIGISSVTIIISAGDSFKQVIYGQIEGFGSNYINAEVRVPQSSGGTMSQAQGVVITTMTDDDRKEIMKLPHVDKAYSAITAQDIVSWQSQRKKALIYGLTADFVDIDSMEIDQGRFYTEEEDDDMAMVVVLGSGVKEELFGNNNAIGETVKIDKKSFKVIGVAKSRGAVFFLDMDDMVYMPLKTTQKLLLGVDYVIQIVSQIDDPSREEEVSESIRQVLRDRHDITDPNKDDFEVMGAAEAKDLMDTIIGGITLLLVALAAVSLVVGGVGIMNIMYATVAERTFEIGLRKSVGATKQDILRQFLYEAVIITFFGGIFGIAIGIAVTYLVHIGAQYYNFDWPFAISFVGLTLSFFFSIIVGLIFGLYPAKQAAELNPIMALRKE